MGREKLLVCFHLTAIFSFSQDNPDLFLERLRHALQDKAQESEPHSSTIQARSSSSGANVHDIDERFHMRLRDIEIRAQASERSVSDRQLQQLASASSSSFSGVGGGGEILSASLFKSNRLLLQASSGFFKAMGKTLYTKERMLRISLSKKNFAPSFLCVCVCVCVCV